MAAALAACPADALTEILSAVAGWLATPAALGLGDPFWRLWDRVLGVLPVEPDEGDPARYYEKSINAPVGNLAEALLKRLSASAVGALAQDITRRLEALCGLSGQNGVLARVRLAAEVAFLHARAPQWTRARIVPSFSWTDPLAIAMWSGRVYSGVIGPTDLFALTKEPFLELFARDDVPAKLKEDYADWLLVPLFNNQAHGTGYALTTVEARAALRRAGTGALWQVGHRFAIEMEAAKADEKVSTWRDVVGPVFRGTWPLDEDLRTSRANFKLVQMLRASGDAFPLAVDDVIPFVAKEDGQGHLTTIHSLGDADEALYELAPRKLLDLVDAIVGDSGSVFGLKRVLDRILVKDGTVVGLAKYQRLRRLASRER